MARSSSGKSVARAAATGGGATYRGQMPVNWYAALVLIVLIGAGSVVLSKWHYNQGAGAVEPTTNTTWHAGLAFDICGTMEPALAASPASAATTTGLTSSSGGVLQIHPKDSSEAGDNATLGKFAQGFTGLTITNSTLKYPSSGVPEYKNGQKCGTGTPDAGKVGTVQARWWILSASGGKSNEQTEVGGLQTTSPADLRFQNRQLITVGFLPSGQKLPKPPGSTILALEQTLAGAGPVATTTTTTTTPATASTSTSVPSSSTSVPGSSTTTAKPAAVTTTTAAPSTTTTKPTGTTSTTK
jgi:hypothetical protein